MPSIALKDNEPQPYTKGDMFREPGTGRSLHDDACRFYREVMGLATPINHAAQPSLTEISQSIDKKVEKDDLRMWEIIYSLNLTEKESLWSEGDDLGSSVGLLWGACKSYRGAALKHIHAVNMNEKSCTQKRKAPAISSVTTKRKKVTPEKSDGKQGKKLGKKNWNDTEITLLLDATEEALPCGKEMWEKVATQCLSQIQGWCRAGVACKAKFEKMAFAKNLLGRLKYLCTSNVQRILKRR